MGERARERQRGGRDWERATRCLPRLSPMYELRTKNPAPLIADRFAAPLLRTENRCRQDY